MVDMQIASNLAGYHWISAFTGVRPVQPLRVTSVIGTSRATHTQDGHVRNTYTRPYAPEPTLATHLTFALKYEGVELDFMARVFAATGPGFLRDWLQREPTSSYARRIGFFYEWLTAELIEGVADSAGNYVDAIDADRYLVATRPDKNRRWRVNDNLPGTRDFCPMIRRVSGVPDSAALTQAIDSMQAQFDPGTLERALRWLSVKESRASFVIESEGREEDRIRRFARAMDRHCGRMEDPLGEAGLQALQTEIMGSATTGFRLGFRQSPVFVGHTSAYLPVIDYLTPPHDQVPTMMAGLRALSERTRGQDSLLRAAAVSFGLVYIHPLSDGNGRLSRFLINDTLRRDGVVPESLILPVSAVISESSASRHAYDQALERFSRPLMSAVDRTCGFGVPVIYPDGVRSNLQFDAWDDALPSWRYPDLTDQARYLAEVIVSSVAHGLQQEALYLRRYDQAEEGLKQLIEGSAEDYATIIRSVTGSTGISNKLRKTYPLVFDDQEREKRIVQVVLGAFELLDDTEVETVTPRLAVRPRRAGQA